MKKSLQEQYNKLENNINNYYNKLTKDKDYNFLIKEVEQHYQEDEAIIKQYIADDKVSEAIQDFDLEEILRDIYFINYNGTEVEAKLLSIHKQFIEVYIPDNGETEVVLFSQLSTLQQQIEITEELDNYITVEELKKTLC